MKNGEYRGLRGESLNTITVGELRDALEPYDEDMLVVASCNYGDYHNTEQAVVLGEPTEVQLNASAYSQSGFSIDTSSGDDPDVCDLCNGEGHTDENTLCDQCKGRGYEQDDRPMVLLLGSL